MAYAAVLRDVVQCFTRLLQLPRALRKVIAFCRCRNLAHSTLEKTVWYVNTPAGMHRDSRKQRATFVGALSSGADGPERSLRPPLKASALSQIRALP